MEISEILAHNLIRLRKKSSISLSALAEKTGLSKGVLSQLEKGDGNPTINTLWKIADALRVPYSALLEKEHLSPAKIERKDLVEQKDDDGHYRIYCYYPSTSTRDFEWFLLELDPGYSHTTFKQNEHSEEYIIIKEGILQVTVDEEVYDLKEGDSLYFNAELQHTYRNIGKKMALIYCINAYPKN